MGNEVVRGGERGREARRGWRRAASKLTSKHGDQAKLHRTPVGTSSGNIKLEQAWLAQGRVQTPDACH